MGRRKAQSEGHLPVLLAVLLAQHGRPAKRIPTLRPLILSRLARPPPRLAACLGPSCPLVRGGARVPPGTRLFAHRVSPTSWTGCFFCPRFHLGAPGCLLSQPPSRWAIHDQRPGALASTRAGAGGHGLQVLAVLTSGEDCHLQLLMLLTLAGARGAKCRR